MKEYLLSLLLDAGEDHAAFLVGIALAEERPGRAPTARLALSRQTGSPNETGVPRE